MDRTRMTLALAGLAVTVLLSAAATASALTMRACRDMPGFGCGILTVPLDRSGTLPGTADLRFAVETGRQARRRPLLVALTGGPGQGGVQAARGFSFSLAPMLRRYRLAVVDQRGTGRSGPLDCPALQRIRAPAAITADKVARCAEAVGPRRAFYTTIDSVQDLDALRAGLGAERMALMGVSYGTYVAQQYARVHPDRVERLILDSVVPPGGVDPFQLESFRALDRVLREQCAREACAGVTSDPVADVAALVTRMDSGGPITGRVFDARGRPRRETYRRSDELFDLLVAGDLNQYLQPALPSAIRAAVRGDPGPILRLRRIGLGGPVRPSELSLAVEVITGCEDSRLPYPFTVPVEERIDRTERAVAALPAAELAPFAVDTVRRLSIAQGCLFFPPDAVSPPATGPLPDVPALVLGGRLDIRTPLEGARQVAAELPRAQVVAVPGTGHDELDNDVSGCTQAALRRFAADRRVGRPCAGVTNAVSVVPLPPRSVRDYRAAPGVPGVRGRVVAAVVDTSYDATLTVLQTVFAGFHQIRGGGLRGGSFHGDDQGNVWLRRYALVPGLRVTGRFDSAAESPAGRLKVDGPGKLDGILRLKTDGAVTGRLGGRAVRSPATFSITAQADAAAAGGRTARRRLTGPDSPDPCDGGGALGAGSRCAEIRPIRPLQPLRVCRGMGPSTAQDTNADIDHDRLLPAPVGNVLQEIGAAAGLARQLLRWGYRRLGPRYPMAVLLLVLQVQYVACTVAIAILAIYVPMSSAEFALVLTVGLAIQLLWNFAAIRVAWRQLQTVFAWIRGGRDPDVIAEAWQGAGSLPLEYLREQMLSVRPAVLLLTFCTYATWELGLPGYAIAILALTGVLVAVFCVALTFQLIEEGMAPVLEDIAAAAPEEANLDRAGVSLRLRLLVVLPAISIASGLAVAGLTQRGHGSLPDLAIDAAIVLGVTAIITVPVVALLSRAIVTPIRALREATERVGAGQLATRVALISSDETGQLARSFNRMVAGLQERERLREAFGAFVDPDLAERVAREGIDVAGEEVELSVMFTDVRNFTSFAERADPHTVVARLNDLYEHVVPVILSHGGHANKFIGDGLLAVFGVPERYADHADRAVAAALEIARLVNERYAGDIRVGVGVNSGRVVAGTIGGGGRLDFTVIGDPVNVAARVESATRETGDDVLIAEPTWARLTREFAGFDERPAISLKGKSEPVRLFAPRTPSAASRGAGAGHMAGEGGSAGGPDRAGRSQAGPAS